MRRATAAINRGRTIASRLVPAPGKTFLDERLAKRTIGARDRAQLAPVPVSVAPARDQCEAAGVQQDQQPIAGDFADLLLASASRREDFRGVDIGDPDLVRPNQNVSPSTTQFTRIGASQSVKRTLSVSLRRGGGMTKVLVSYRSGISDGRGEGTPMATAKPTMIAVTAPATRKRGAVMFFLQVGIDSF